MDYQGGPVLHQITCLKQTANWAYSWTLNSCMCMQAYPLYATIGLGCAGAVFYLGRLALGPDTM